MLFLFKFLGSAIFWVVYVGLSFFVSTILFKYLAPKFMRRLKHNSKYGLSDEKMKELKKEYGDTDDFTRNYYSFKEWLRIKKELSELPDLGEAVALLIVYLVFWPFILIGVILWGMFKYIIWGIIKHVLWASVHKAIISIDKIIPNIEVKKKGEYNDTKTTD